MATTTTIVPPSSKHSGRPAPEPVALHALDLLMPPVYFRLHLIFPPSQLDVAEHLKASLADALELYPPIAGSISPHGPEGHLHIVSDNSGAELIFTTCEDKYSDLPGGDADDLAPRGLLALPGDSRTLFAVKITKFSCGTVALGVGVHHYVADFTGLYDFLSTWASLARGDPNPTPPPPHAFVRDPASVFPSVPAAPTSAPGLALLPSPPSGPPPPPPPSMQFSTVIDEQSLTLLKTASQPRDKADGWVSTGDALSALLWRAVIRARIHAGVSVPEQCELGIAVDGRERSPGKKLVGEYFANCNTAVAASLPRETLLAPGSLPTTALAVRHALTSQLTPDSLAQKLAFLQNAPSPQQVVPTIGAALTNWSKYRLSGSGPGAERLNFGWGAPVAALPGAVIFPPGSMHIMQYGTEGNLRVTVAVEEEAGEWFEKDEEFWSYAKKL